MPYDRTAYFRRGQDPRDAQTLANIAKEGAMDVERERAAAFVRAAEERANADQEIAHQQRMGGQYTADKGFQSHRYTADQSLAGQRYTADKNLETHKAIMPWQHTEAGTKFTLQGQAGFTDPAKRAIAENQALLRKRLEEEVGIPDKEGKNLSLPVNPAFQAIHKKMERLVMQGVSPDEAYKVAAPELHKHYYTPENVQGAISLLEKETGRPMPPEARQEVLSGRPEVMERMYPYLTKAAKEPRGFISRTFSPAPEIGNTQPSTPPGATETRAPITPPVQGTPITGSAVSYGRPPSFREFGENTSRAFE